ncbi:uncharacterized protein [Linepithema humile]|nr:PREDICTED: uncharacterized protein LOC105679885 isoform X2 [Linepithema humile]XP_012235617.1 PREDICTED: uncharacterized protein LOC105679885 isoform X2 [Linepithema humile]
MDKPVSTDCEKDITDVENSKSVLIDTHIKELIKLSKLNEIFNKKIEYSRNQMSKLLGSNCNIEMNCNKLAQKITDMDAKISENTTIHITKKQEMKDFQNIRANLSHKQWDNCLSEIGNYANNFSQWITDYSREVLMKDIRDHQEECKKIGEELTILKKELDDMRAECDSDYIVANVDVNDLPSINGVISDIKPSNNNLMDAVRSTENTLNKIQKKIKQRKIAVNEYETKDKSSKF